MTIEELKAKYGTVYTLSVPSSDEGEEITVYLRDIDRATYTIVTKAVQDDILKATEILINTLWVGGDEPKKITTNLYALRSASNTIVELITVKTGTLKKN